MANVVDDLVDVFRSIDNEFQLVSVAIHQLLGNFGPEAGLIVSTSPVPCPALRRLRIAELGADGHKVAGDGLENGSGRFNGDVLSRLRQSLAQLSHFGRQHGFTAGDDDVIGGVFMGHLVDDLLNAHRGSLGLPRGKRSITESATQIAAAGAHKYAVGSCKQALALPRLIDFGNQHVNASAGWSLARV